MKQRKNEQTMIKKKLEHKEEAKTQHWKSPDQKHNKI